MKDIFVLRGEQIGCLNHICSEYLSQDWIKKEAEDYLEEYDLSEFTIGDWTFKTHPDKGAFDSGKGAMIDYPIYLENSIGDVWEACGGYCNSDGESYDHSLTFTKVQPEGRYYIVELDFDWADEISFDCFEVFTESELKFFKESLANLGDDEREISIGTNEAINISPDDLLDMIENSDPVKITEEEYNVIRVRIGSSYGLLTISEMFDEIEWNELIGK
jgi:hypothetical protein